MPSNRSDLEQQIERVELRPFTLDGFHRRRQRKQRNRRIGTAVVALAVAAVAIGGLARAFLSGPEPRPADQPTSPFVGTWSSRELDFPGIPQTMTIRATEDGGLDIVLHDDSSMACSTRQTRTDGIPTSSTLRGTGRLEDAATLVVPSPVLVCGDGRLPIGTGFPEERGGAGYTLVLDPATDRLFDNLGVAWHRGATLTNWAGPRANASEGTIPGAFSFLYGEVTFHVDRPWSDHIESYLDPRIFWLIGQPDDAWIEILANPSPEASCTAPERVPASAEEMVQAIQSNPRLEATAPVVERVGGIDALRLDVAPAPGALECVGLRVPVVTVSGRQAWGGIDQGDRARLYVVDVPGGSVRALVIKITAPEAAFERTLRAAAPVVDSFEFHAG